MQMVVEVIGMKAFKDTLDGKAIDSATLFTIVKLDERFNKPGINFKVGDALEEWKLGSSELVFRIQHLKPSMQHPIAMRLEVERVSNGRETKEIVTDAVPLEPPPARASAPATAKPA